MGEGDTAPLSDTMRILSTPAISASRLAATLCLALLTAGCERLGSVAAITRPATPTDSARYAVVKDTAGRTVRFDSVTGKVTPVEKTAARSTPRVSRRTPPVPPLPASLTTVTPTPVVAPQPVVVARPEPARIAVDEMCAEHEDIFAV